MRIWIPGLATLIAAPASASEPVVKGNAYTVQVKDGRKKTTYYQVSDAGILVQADAGILEIELRQLKTKKAPTAAGSLQLLRNDSHISEGTFNLANANGRKGKAQGKQVTGRVIRQVLVPEGQHTYRISVEAPDAMILALFSKARSANSKQMVSAERPLPGLTAPATPEPPAPTPAPKPEPPPPVQPATVETISNKVAVSSDDPPAAETDTAGTGVIEPVAIPPAADKSVSSSTKALATAVAKGYAQLGDPAPFHRVAVPYFEEVGDATTENNLGRLIAELLSVELAQHEPFVVIERERLGQVMREHRLKGLGIVDEGSAAEFGKVLGAQSLISGTVAEAGAEYVVTLRQVEVESGKILVSGQISIERDGLIALSSDMVVTRSKTGALFRSALIPGWGQLYNDHNLKAILFLGAGLGTAGTGLGMFIASQANRSKYERNTPGSVKFRDKANQQITAANWLFISYGIVWAINVLDAYLSGTDTTTVDLEAAPGAAVLHF